MKHGFVKAAAATPVLKLADPAANAAELVRLMQEAVGGQVVGAGAYSCLRELTILLTVSIVCLLRREERAALSWDLLRHPHPYLSGVFAGAAYLLVLLVVYLICISIVFYGHYSMEQLLYYLFHI